MCRRRPRQLRAAASRVRATEGANNCNLCTIKRYIVRRVERRRTLVASQTRRHLRCCRRRCCHTRRVNDLKWLIIGTRENTAHNNETQR